MSSVVVDGTGVKIIDVTVGAVLVMPPPIETEDEESHCEVSSLSLARASTTHESPSLVT